MSMKSSRAVTAAVALVALGLVLPAFAQDAGEPDKAAATSSSRPPVLAADYSGAAPAASWPISHCRNDTSSSSS